VRLKLLLTPSYFPRALCSNMKGEGFFFSRGEYDLILEKEKEIAPVREIIISCFCVMVRN